MTDLLPNREMGPCPVCGQTLSRPISSCSRCHTPHHADCWSYNEGCAIFGCGTKPAAPPPAARTVPRISLVVVLLTLLSLLALGGRSICTTVWVARIDDLSVEPHSRVPSVTWMTTPRSRCVVEVVRVDEPSVVLFRRHTPRFHHHRVELGFVKPGETYLVRVTSQSGWFSGETMSQLYRAPVERPPVAAMPPPPAATPPFDSIPSAFGPPESLVRPRLLPGTLGTPQTPGFRPRDPFRLPRHPGDPGHGVQMRVNTGALRGPFSPFDLRIDSQGAQMSWRTRQPFLFCRVLIMRDSTLRGVEKVVDATSRAGGRFHRVSLDRLEPDTSYQLLVLGFPGTGDPVQSPVLSFRTLP